MVIFSSLEASLGYMKLSKKINEYKEVLCTPLSPCSYTQQQPLPTILSKNLQKMGCHSVAVWLDPSV